MTKLDLFDDRLNGEIRRNVIEPVLMGDFETPLESISEIQRRLHTNIPEKKRISYGRYYTVKVLGERLYAQLVETGGRAFEFAVYAFEHGDDYIVRGVVLEMISQRGLEALDETLPYFEVAAADEHWEGREFAAGFFRKLVKVHPQKAGHSI